MSPFGYGPRAIALWNRYRHFDLRVSGAEHVPAQGPALVIARHYHHLFDGAALILGLPRQPHLVVALDWTASPLARRLMETACRLAEWPVTLRTERLTGTDAASAFTFAEVRRYVRRAIEFASDLLARGDVVAIFPEGYPTIDPAGSPKARDDEFLPFRPGALAIAAHATRRGVRVPILPAGFAYAREGGRTSVRLNVGEPVVFTENAPRDALLAGLTARVRALSGYS